MKKQKLITKISTAMFYSFLSMSIFAQSPASVTWSLLTNISSSNSGSVTSESMAIGSNLSGTSFGSTFNTSSTGWMRVATTAPQLPASYTATSYVEFTISPSSGNDLTVTTISANVGGGGTGNCKLAAYYSLSNFPTTPGTNLGSCSYNSGTRTTTTAAPISLLNTSSVTDANSLASFSSLNISVTNGQTLKVRFYVWSTSTNKYFPLKNVVISGTTTALSCTAPDSKTVSGTAAICSGTSTDVTLASSQSGVTYQLYAGASASGSAVLGTGGDLTWSVSPTTTTTYTVKTTTAGGYCETTMSGSAVVTVNAATSISAQSSPTQTKFVGESFNAMTVTAAGTGTLTYQWKSSDDAVTNTSGDDANVDSGSNSFTPSSASAGTKYYYCVVTSDCGSATSAVSGAIITNNTVPTVVLTSGSNTTSVNVNAAMTSAVYTYSFVADDANVSAEWYTNDTYSSTTNAPSGLLITKDTEANTVTVSGTPANGVYGTLYYKIIVNEASGNSVEGTITVNVPTPTVTLSSAVGTNAQIKKANTAIISISYTLTNATGATVGTLPAGLSGVYNNGTFTISGTIDNAATLGTANYTVTATPYTGYGGSAVTASGSVVVKSATAKEICYLVSGATQSANDTKLFPMLNNSPNYIVTLRTAAASAPLATVYDPYDLIILNETVAGANAEAVALKLVNKPILSLKSFTYSTGRWVWGTPDNGKANNGTVTVKQPNHPIFAGITLTNGNLDLLSSTGTIGVQPADVTIGGITVAIAPKNASPFNNATAIHDVSASIRGVASAKYILIPISDTNYGNMTNNMLTLLSNAINYLLTGTQFVAEPLQYRSTGTGDWNSLTWESSADGTNWSQDVSKPATGNVSSVSIQTSSTVNLNTNTTFDVLSLSSGAVLNINAGQQLTINDSFVNNGTIHLKSDANGTATALLPSNVSGTGTAIAEQYLASTRNWYISSPISNAVAPAGYTYYQRDEAGASWTSQPFIAGNSFIPGKGYIALPGSTESVIAFSTETGGSLNKGNIDVNLTFSGASSKGFNLIGNPYPSHLTWTKTFVDANASLIEPSIYYRTTTGTLNNQAGWSFKTINASTGEVSPVGTSNTIPPMQAFWIRAKATGTLTLNSDLTKSHNVSNPLKVPATKNTDRQRLRLEVDNGTASDETVVYFDAAASNGYDRYDSPKFAEANTATQIYTLVGTEKLVINGMNSIPLNQEISLGFVPGSATTFSLRATELTNIPSDVRVILRDNVSKTETDLSDGMSAYEFAPATTVNNRFSLIFRTLGMATGFEKSIEPKANVYVNLNNQIVINVPEKCNYSIYNVMGQLIENGILNYKLNTINCKLNTGVYFVVLNNALCKVFID